MKRFFAGLVTGAMLFGGVSLAVAGKRPVPRFGVARVQGVEPTLDIVSGIADPHNLGFDVIAPPDEHLSLDWTVRCLMPDGSVKTDSSTYDDDAGPEGSVAVWVNHDHYRDAVSCEFDVSALSDGSGVLKVSLRGAGDLPVEPVPAPSPSV